MEVGCVLINIELIVLGFIVFFGGIGMVSYGAKLEQRYKNLQEDYDELKKKKEK